MHRATRSSASALAFFLSACGIGDDAPSAPSSGTAPAAAPAAVAASLLDQSGELHPGPAGTAGRAGYDVTVGARDRLTVSLTSTAFDPVLRVQLPNGSTLTNDDFQGSRSESRLEVEVPAAGTMKVVVEGYAPEAAGPFRVAVTRAAADPGIAAIATSNLGARPPAGAQAAAAAASGARGRSHHGLPGGLPGGTALAFGRRVNGMLPTAPTLPTGEPMQVYTLSGVTAGQRVTVDVGSDAFDPYLLVQSPNGQLWENDDTGGTTASRVSFVASVPGAYRVIVSAYRAGMSGAFEIEASDAVAGAVAAAAPPTATPAPGPVTPGRTIDGELANGDQQLRSGEFYDTHELPLTAGQRVDLEARSTDFDTYLIVLPPNGQQQENDDRTQGNTNAGLELVATEAGTYRVLVTSYRPGETGRYALAIGTPQGGGSVVPEVVTPRSPDAPRTPGGGRVFAILAGISDYPGDGNDLPECANDARKLSEALGRRGLLGAEQQVVLTDAQATRANLASAFARMARDVRPDDVFVFFYSGHGAQGAPGSRDVREIDGRDESIVLHDGNLLDDDFARMLDQVRARVSVTALDSCFSGGFSKDVVTRPGRIGLFSSEEDVLSAVASQFQAGGYLSHFLRTGVGGDADADPADGVLTVGELTHFVYRQFAHHATDVQLQGAYQQLVVDRGAVPVDQVLWRYR